MRSFVLWQPRIGNFLVLISIALVTLIVMVP